jgi:hypothetical protein
LAPTKLVIQSGTVNPLWATALAAFADLQKSTVTDENKLKRLTIDLTAAEHRALKGKAAQAGLTMRKLVLKVLRQEGLLGRSKKKGAVAG